MQARTNIQLDASKDRTLIQSVGPGCCLSGTRMQTDEAAVHLREIRIDWGIPVEEACLYTSRSLKATMLSCLAKIGAPFKARRMLGYHAKFIERSTICYSRNAMAWPWRHLGKVLQFIKDGFFDPDTTRSGTWAQQDDSTAADAFNKSIPQIAEEVADDDPRRYKGTTLLGQAFEEQWEHILLKPHYAGEGATVATLSPAPSTEGTEESGAEWPPLVEGSPLDNPLRDAEFVHIDGEATPPMEGPFEPFSLFAMPLFILVPKRARVGPYEHRDAVGKGLADPEMNSVANSEHTIAADDLYPFEVAVDTDTNPSVSDQSDNEIAHLEDAAFVSLLRDKVSWSDFEKLTNHWNNGLSPEPLFSFFHEKTRCRHWSFEPFKPVWFL